MEKLAQVPMSVFLLSMTMGVCCELAQLKRWLPCIVMKKWDFVKRVGSSLNGFRRKNKLMALKSPLIEVRMIVRFCHQ